MKNLHKKIKHKIANNELEVFKTDPNRIKTENRFKKIENQLKHK